MLHILFIGCGDPVPTFILRRLNAIALRKVQVTVVLRFGQQCDLHPDISIIRQGNWGRMKMIDSLKYLIQLILHFPKFVSIFFLHRNMKVMERIRASLVLFPLTRLKKVSLVHFQWLTMIDTFYILKKIYNVPFVASVRGSQITIYPLTRSGYSEVVIRSIGLADWLHLVSKDLIKNCLYYGAANEKMFVNYNGIDLSKFFALNARRDSKYLKLVSVGALMWRKAFFFQLLIMVQLRKGGIEVQLSVLGDGPDKEGLIYLSYKLGMKDQVCFLGHGSEHSVREAMQDSDIYLSCSAAEGLPNSLVEAAACGLPIVTFECEGVREIIEDGSTGYIVPFGDTDAAVDRILQLEGNPEHRRQMGVAARVKMEREFDEKYWVEDMIGQYNRLSAPV